MLFFAFSHIHHEGEPNDERGEEQDDKPAAAAHVAAVALRPKCLSETGAFRFGHQSNIANVGTFCGISSWN